ncbi:beta-aspartyl-peptidase [Ruminiclostridium papyrosolvens]|uniref:Isoaspartyl dipeptidase n=1 Tax=Ruminiclostridium papyrosolvens C7 TaxID=1330534 RepID=U4QWH3_9FIRM|nr:beta-aspartyl-peptidase [Ruminiclostridium papyrosolvens]EPR07624.1 isoaspartyl dipeptidase [Ruminiclostridium papyrosolvens C7]
MFKLLKDATVYSPEYLGKKDILFCFDKVALIEDNIYPKGFKDIELVNCDGKIVFPGFIDLHVHITGGGGEGGFTTRTEEAKAADILKYGITTVVGVLGADGVTRNMPNLYAKARQLELEGLSTYIYTGSYQVPVITLTGSVQSDMVFVDKVIGVGEICLADSRTFEPSFDEISRIAAQTRNGAIISGKAGLVHFHLGLGESAMEYMFRLANETLIPKQHILPTHVNRTKRLFSKALEYLKQGGNIDLTAGFIPTDSDPECVATYDALRTIQDSNLDFSGITISSDAYGSVPTFDENGNVVSSETVSCKILFDEVRTAIKDRGIPVETAIGIITKNAAQRLKIDDKKGALQVGKDADCVICDSGLNIVNVIAKGKMY